MPDNNIYENQYTSGEVQTSPEARPFCGTENVTNNNVYQSNVPYGNVQYQNNVPYVTYIPYGFTPKTFEERKGIRKAANLAAISMLVVTAVLLFCSIAYNLFLLSLGFSQETVIKSLEEPAVMQLMQIILSSFLFTVPFIIIYKIGKLRISDLVLLGKPDKKDILPLFLIGISFCSFANIAVNYASAIFEMFGIDYNVDYGENPQGFFGFMLSLIATVFVPALVEEFACRGLILGSLRKFGEGFSILVSAIVFGIMHGNFEQIPFAFLVGLVLGFIAVKSGTLWIAVLVHGFNNFISVFFSYFMDDISTQVQNIVYVCYLSLSMILGIVAILMLKDRLPDFFKLKKSETEAKENVKVKWFFTTPTVIIFAVIAFLESLIYLFP